MVVVRRTRWWTSVPSFGLRNLHCHCAPWQLERKTAMSISASLSLMTFQRCFFVLIFYFQLVVLLIPHVVPFPPPPLVNLWRYITANWKRKPHIQGDLSLMWNFILTRKSRSRNPKLFKIHITRQTMRCPQTTTTCTLLIIHWQSSFGCIWLHLYFQINTNVCHHLLLIFDFLRKCY